MGMYRGKTRFTRRFDDKTYRYSAPAYNKTDAKSRAAALKKRGFLVRTTKTVQGVYELWARKKD